MFKTLSTLTIATAATYLIVRQLLTDEAPAQINRLPEAPREVGFAARRLALRAQTRARLALNEARAEQRTAELELTAEYHRKAGRTP